MSNEDTREAGKATVDMALNAVGVRTRGAQAIAIEVIDYARKTNESSAAAWEKLAGAESLDSAFAVQSQFARSVYEDFVAEAAKLREIYVEFAGEAHAPLRTAFAEPHACT
jgi:phasin family protein